MELLERFNRVMKSASTTLDLIAAGELREQFAVLRKELVDLRDESIDLQEAVIALKARNISLQEQLFETQRLLGDRERFETEKGRYVASRLSTGSVVYALKDEERRDGEPVLYLCAHCFERNEKAYLQPVKREFHKDTYACNVCGANILIPNDATMEVITRPRRTPFPDY